MRALAAGLLGLLSVRAAWGSVNFVRNVKPILENNCVRCHDADGASRGVRLDYEQMALMTVKKGRPDESLLYNVVKAGIMPPGERKLTKKQIQTLRKWIQQGAYWPDGVELVGINPFLREGIAGQQK